MNVTIKYRSGTNTYIYLFLRDNIIEAKIKRNAIKDTYLFYSLGFE